MKPEDIHLSDWLRILVGEVPASFYLEALFRIVFIYLLLIASMRVMGNRMGKPLTRNKIIAMVSLAAANGVALMAADRGLLPVVLIAAIVIGYQRAIAWGAFRNARFESLVLDDLSILAEDGRLNLNKLEEGVLCRNQLFAQLRKESVKNLGQVRRAYQEAKGNFSVLTFGEAEPRAGLSILPTRDAAFRQEQQRAEGQFACASCGHVLHSAQAPPSQCPRCAQQQWQPAVLGA